MPDRIDRALVQHVATLASLSLTEAEAEKLTQEFGSILKYFGELDSLDTSNVPPTAQVALGREGGLRPDEVRAGLTHEEALGQAPRTSEGGFAVPAFVEAGAADLGGKAT